MLVVGDDGARLLELETAGVGGMILTTTDACEQHKAHDPSVTYCEIHHIVPRAWQGFWQPADPPFPAKVDGQELWDARTVTVCRTGHGNIHFWITLLMHAWGGGADLSTLAKLVREQHPEHLGHADFACALEALQRYEEVGGDLGGLVKAGLWGQI